MSEMPKENKFWFGFFIGGLLGAVTLFFLGTKEGKKTGKILKERGKDFLDELDEKLESLEQKGKEFIEHGKELKEEVIEKIENKKDDITQGTTKKLDSALSQIEKIQEEGLETTSALRKKLFKNIPKK